MSKDLSLVFPLEPDPDGWPPVGSESIPVERLGDDVYRVLVPPMFVGDLAIDDHIRARLGEANVVMSWQTERKSEHSTVWVLSGKCPDVRNRLSALVDLGCTLVRFPDVGLFSLDIPSARLARVSSEVLDEIERDGGHIAESAWRF